jgi:hypothetical protein
MLIADLSEVGRWILAGTELECLAAALFIHASSSRAASMLSVVIVSFFPRFVRDGAVDGPGAL